MYFKVSIRMLREEKQTETFHNLEWLVLLGIWCFWVSGSSGKVSVTGSGSALKRSCIHFPSLCCFLVFSTDTEANYLSSREELN